MRPKAVFAAEGSRSARPSGSSSEQRPTTATTRPHADPSSQLWSYDSASEGRPAPPSSPLFEACSSGFAACAKVHLRLHEDRRNHDSDLDCSGYRRVNRCTCAGRCCCYHGRHFGTGSGPISHPARGPWPCRRVGSLQCPHRGCGGRGDWSRHRDSGKGTVCSVKRCTDEADRRSGKSANRTACSLLSFPEPTPKPTYVPFSA